MARPTPATEPVGERLEPEGLERTSEPAPPRSPDRRVSYQAGDPDSAPELIHFINCNSVQEIQEIDPQNLLEAARQGQATLAEWEFEIIDLHQEIQQLKDQLKIKDNIITYLETRTPPTEATTIVPRTKEIDVPVAEFSDGKDPKFENWKAQITGKFEVNHLQFPTERAKKLFLFSKTTGEAQTHLAARYHNEVNTFETAQEMIDHLAAIYMDPHRVENARYEFKKLLMKPSTPFHDFYTKFLHLAAESETPLTSYRAELYDKLTLELQKAILPTANTLTTYKQLADQCLLLDQGLKRIKERTDRIAQYSSKSEKPTNIRPTASNLIRASSATATATPPVRVRPTYDNPDRQVLSLAGACFKCRQPGHRAFQCPLNSVKAIEGPKAIEESTNRAIESGNASP